MSTMRTQKMYLKYMKYKKAGHLEKCPLCYKAPLIKTYKHWKIVNNIFPWDKIAKIQHMVIPKRHVAYEELNSAEKLELDSIKNKYIHQSYDIIAEATHKNKSIPEHFHLHLIVVK